MFEELEINVSELFNFNDEYEVYDEERKEWIQIDNSCYMNTSFPDIEKADQEITAITLSMAGKIFVFGCGNYKPNKENIEYFKCNDEYELIQQFIKTWVFLDIDIITGWNIEFFDIPYIINRIKVLFNEKEAKRLSPLYLLFEKKITFRGKDIQSYILPGLAILDYYQLYRKFTQNAQESYKLDYIAQEEIDEKKISYDSVNLTAGLLINSDSVNVDLSKNKEDLHKFERYCRIKQLIKIEKEQRL